MLRRLTCADLVRGDGLHDLSLTEHGTHHAVALVRRHRLLETFLVQVLDLPWQDAHTEAERLERAVSDRLLDRIDDHLGIPVATRTATPSRRTRSVGREPCPPRRPGAPSGSSVWRTVTRTCCATSASWG